ncbi:MAG: PEP-CTERM sorting domain-containing protein [Opitutaceae bacterium]|nr:PEP-CTERM sorting domain-containing protein [Opitutaceae bacterium]
MRPQSTRTRPGARPFARPAVLRGLLALGAGLLTGLDAQAMAVRTWIGQNNGSWSEDANWDGSNVSENNPPIGVPTEETGLTWITNGTTAVLDGSGDPGAVAFLMVGISEPAIQESGTPGESGYTEGAEGVAGPGGLTIINNSLSAAVIFIGGDSGALMTKPVASQPEFESPGTLTLDNALVNTSQFTVVGAGQDGHVTLGGGSLVTSGYGGASGTDGLRGIVFGREAFKMFGSFLGTPSDPGYDFADHPGESTLTVKAGNGGTPSHGVPGLDDGTNLIIAPVIVFSGNSTIDLEAGATLYLTSMADGSGELANPGITAFLDGATVRFNGTGADSSTRFISIGDLTLSYTEPQWNEELQRDVDVPVTMTLGVGDMLVLGMTTIGDGTTGKVTLELNDFAAGAYELVHATAIITITSDAESGEWFDNVTNDTIGDLFYLTGNSAEGAYVFVQDNSIWVQIVAIPEPATYAALAGLALLAWVARRRRRGNRA